MEHISAVIKVVMVGDSGVGKSCLLLKYADDLFDDTHVSTIGVDFKIRTLTANGKNIKMQLWDTAGQDRFRTIVSSYFRNASVILLFFDLTNKVTFNNVISWYEDTKKNGFNGPYYLIGTKCDLDKSIQVNINEINELCNKFNFRYFETSAKLNKNIPQLFDDIALQYVTHNTEEIEMRDKQLIKVGSFRKIEKDGCKC